MWFSTASCIESTPSPSRATRTHKTKFSLGFLQNEPKFGHFIRQRHEQKAPGPPTCVHRGTSSSTGSDSYPHLPSLPFLTHRRVPLQKRKRRGNLIQTRAHFGEHGSWCLHWLVRLAKRKTPVCRGCALTRRPSPVLMLRPTGALLCGNGRCRSALPEAGLRRSTERAPSPLRRLCFGMHMISFSSESQTRGIAGTCYVHICLVFGGDAAPQMCDPVPCGSAGVEGELHLGIHLRDLVSEISATSSLSSRLQLLFFLFVCLHIILIYLNIILLNSLYPNTQS